MSKLRRLVCLMSDLLADADEVHDVCNALSLGAEKAAELSKSAEGSKKDTLLEMTEAFETCSMLIQEGVAGLKKADDLLIKVGDENLDGDMDAIARHMIQAIDRIYIPDNLFWKTLLTRERQ